MARSLVSRITTMKKVHRDWLIVILISAALLGLAPLVAHNMDAEEGYLDFLAYYLILFVAYLAAVFFLSHHIGAHRGMVAFVFFVSIALRGVFLFEAPVLSDDIYRYVWDGRVQRQGINPYRYPPQAPEIQHLRDPIFEGINNKDIPTIYPPLMQLLFATTTRFSEDLLWMKGTFTLFDIALIGILVGLLRLTKQSPLKAIIYAWNPLVLVEVAGNGHNDVFALALLLAAQGAILLNKGTMSICFLSLSGLAKLMGFVLAPLFVRSVRVAAWLGLAVTCLIVSWPYLGVDSGAFRGLFEFGTRWRANDGLFHILVEMTRDLDIAKAVAAGLVAGVMGLLILRRTPPLRACYVATGAILLLSSTVHPWYVLWIIPYLCFYPNPAWLLFTATVVLSYHAAFLTPAGLPWTEQISIKLLEYGPFFLLLALSGISRLLKDNN
jgi:hypothetical protein